MPRSIRTAVAASASPSVQMQIVRGFSRAGIELLRMEEDGRSALRAMADLRPDLLVADAQLPALDGVTLTKRALCGFDLPVRPAALILHHREYPLPDREKLIGAGAALVEKPVDPGAFARAVEALRHGDAAFPRPKEQLADLLLDSLGFPDHPGRDCLKRASLLCAADDRLIHSLNGALYPRVGSICSLTAAQAERAMRHAIGLAWQSDKFDNQYLVFADTVDARRGQPTCSEMISRLADILRLEG